MDRKCLGKTHVNGKFICGYSIDLNIDHDIRIGFY